MNFTVYTKDNCPYCKKLKLVLELTGKDFVTYTLGSDFSKNQFYEKFGEGSTFPQVICDSQKIGGCIDTIKFLREKKVIKS